MSETNSQGLKRNVGLFAAICLMTGCGDYPKFCVNLLCGVE